MWPVRPVQLGCGGRRTWREGHRHIGSHRDPYCLRVVHRSWSARAVTEAMLWRLLGLSTSRNIAIRIDRCLHSLFLGPAFTMKMAAPQRTKKPNTLTPMATLELSVRPEEELSWGCAISTVDVVLGTAILVLDANVSGTTALGLKVMGETYIV